jgi:hypothetical protein
MSKVIREIAGQASALLNGKTEGYASMWAEAFAGLIIERAMEAVVETDTAKKAIISPLHREIMGALVERFDPTDPELADPVVRIAIEATDVCMKKYKDHVGSTAWLWEEEFAQLLIEACLDAIYSCDPSPKMIVHEPYGTIGDAVWDSFYGEEDGT